MPGLGQVELGGHFISAREEIELWLILSTQRGIFSREGRLDRRMFQALGQSIQFSVDVIQLRREGIGLGRDRGDSVLR